MSARFFLHHHQSGGNLLVEQSLLITLSDPNISGVISTPTVELSDRGKITRETGWTLLLLCIRFE
jgi:hypothetical protein